MSSRKIRSSTPQLTDPVSFDINNLVFDDAVVSDLGKIKFYRINLATKYSDGTEGDLILGFDRCMSYGVQENNDEITTIVDGREQKTNKLNGYSISLVLRDKDGGSERQNRTIEIIESIVDKCKDHLLQLNVKKSIGKITLDRNDLKKLTPVWYKIDKETGERDEIASPMLYPKLIYAKERKDQKTGDIIPGKIITKFYLADEVDENGEPLEIKPLDFLGKRCTVSCALKIESIFVGQVIKLQCKVVEVDLKPVETKSRRLLTSGWSTYNTSNVSMNSNPLLESYENKIDEEVRDEDENEDDKPSQVLEASEDEEEKTVEIKKTTAKRPAKKTK